MRNRTPWENEYWWPQGLLVGPHPVFILGSGPSLAAVDLSVLAGQSVIAINSSAEAAWEAGLDDQMLFFMDNGWWAKNRQTCEEWRGEVFTLSRQAKREAPKLVKRLEMTTPAPEFPSPGAPYIRWGRSSGHVAISLAIAMGATKIVLLGYDMRLVDGRSHHHERYGHAGHPAIYEDFVRHFEGWNAQARAIGVEIVNATPDSALAEFPMVDLDYLLPIPL